VVVDIDFVQRFESSDINGSEDGDITLTAGPRELRFKGQQYLVSFALPTSTSTPPRHCGLPIGKRDFMGVS
jgi:hypothetical protein